MEDSEKRVMYKIWKTVNKMLKARGYNILQDDLDLTREQFDEQYGNQYESRELMPILSTKGEGEAIFVFFPSEEKVKTKTIEDMQQRMKRENVTHAIVVIKNAITSHATRSMELLKPEFIFDTFLQQELMVDIMEHVLVPTHILISEQEKQQLLKRYNVVETQLPRIQQDDAVARYLGLEKGQVVKIIRHSETAGRYITYRFVH